MIMPNTSHTTGQASLLSTKIDAAEYEKNLEQQGLRDRTVGAVLADIAKIPDDHVTKGKKFEDLTQWALPLIKSAEIQIVQKPRGRDIGIDLIATHAGGYKIAIQCKFYTTRTISWRDISTFIGAAKQEGIKEKWLVCGAKGLSHNINTAGKGFDDVKIVDLRQYLDAVLTTTPPEPREPLPLQQEAIDFVLQGFTNKAERGTLIMACGSGKTFTALRIAENLVPKNANLLFIAPSIALVAQARNEWLNHSTRRLRTLIICSDKTAGHDEDIKPNEIAGQVTTEPQEIASVLTKTIAKDAARATFCTYQSLDKLLKAQTKYGAPKFDLAIVDEAHRTTGLLDDSKPGQFQIIHDPKKIQADKRLYMTATPRIYEKSKSKRDIDAVIVDMNDTEHYGNEFYRLSFKDAVEAGVLCDYRVIALGVSEDMIGADLSDTLLAFNDEIETTKASAKGRAADTQSVLALGAIALAVNGFVRGENTPGVIARSIAYANNIRRSKWLARALQEPRMKTWVTKTARRDHADANKSLTIEAEHLDGTSSALKRHTALQKLASKGSVATPRLITNAQLFTEGVDVPALNAIAFLDPRQSKVDTVQAVGRVMRKSPGKTLGYIIVPVIMAPGADLIETLAEDKSRFKSLGNVLRALQSHDERLYTDLPSYLSISQIEPVAKDKQDRSPPDDDYRPLQETLLPEDVKQAIFAQIAKHTGLASAGRQIADAITVAINRAALILEKEGGAQIIADTIGTPTDNPKESCKTAALLIVNACIMHKRLEETGNLGGLTKIGLARNAENPLSVLYAAWVTILEKDYIPIFQDAALLLKKLQSQQRMHPAVRVLMHCAIADATTLNDLGFDHAGPLYHRVLGTATSDGAFFTKNLSAYLLAGLAFDDAFADWKDMAAVKRLRVADPACGTGTLLMAALKAIKDKAAKAQNLTPKQTEALHKHLVENALHGFDINKYSIQLAACNLTIGAPNTDYRGMNLHTLQHGPLPGTDGDQPHLVRHGALEILLGKVDAELLQQRLADDPDDIYSTDAERKRRAFRAPQNLDAVIYNPPFTDTQLQGGRYSDAVKQAMDDRLEQIRNDLAKKDPAAVQSIGQRSIQPYFTPMTQRLLSLKKGTMAKIIPATMCTSENARAQRQYIAANFHIDMVVTSHDPKHVNFSENTAVHECLVIGRRSLGKRKPTRFIQLATYPANVKEAEALVNAIQSGDAGGYTETLWPADKVAEGNWTPVQWFNPKLAEVADELNTFPNTVQTQHPWSPDCVSFRLTFTYEPSDAGDTFGTISEKLMQTMQATPTHKATARKNKERQAKAMWDRADHALVTSRFSTTSSRLVAIYSEQPALGSAFRPIGVYDKTIAKAMVAFLNSSFGVIQMLNRRTKKLTYPTYSSPQMRTLRLPDPAADLSPLLAAFEKVKLTPLKRLSECHTDPSRKILDHAAAKVIGIDPKITDQWRQWLAREPTITNQKWQPE